MRLSTIRRMPTFFLASVLGLLVVSLAHGATNITLTDLEYCPSVQKYYITGGCPCEVQSTTGAVEITDTTTEAIVVLAQSGSVDTCTGTIYTCMDVPGDSVSRADCIAGTGVTDQQTIAASGAGSYTYDGAKLFTGTAETEYRMHSFLVPSGSGYDNRISHDSAISENFTMNATIGGGGTDLTGAGLFVALADGGNTDETPTGTAGTQTSVCTSMAGSCSEFSHLSPGTGQDIHLAEGAVWNDRTLSLNFRGIASDYTRVACYFDEGDDDGNPVLCENF